ncbi:MAG: hypothetical protein ABFS56_21365 [Pseudomonadota bacterium]
MLRVIIITVFSLLIVFFFVALMSPPADYAMEPNAQIRAPSKNQSVKLNNPMPLS